MKIGNLFAEVRALARDGVMPTGMIDRLQHQLEQVKDVLQGSTAATMGLLAAARGQRRHARELMESVSWLDARAVDDATRECVEGWLVTDAAAEGEWARVRTLLPEAPSTPAMRLFAHLADRVLGRASTLSSDDRYRLPVEAQRFSETFSGKIIGVATPAGDELQVVLQRLLALKEADAQTAREVSALLKSPRLRDRLLERAILLGVGSPDDALLELRTLFEETLGGALTRLAGEEPLLRQVAAREREALIETLHGRLDRLTDACSEGTAPPMPEVWREFVAIRGVYARAVALSEPGERGWPHHVALRLTRYFGTWLRLTKRQRPFAYAVFHFLEVEAAHAGDDASARLARASAELCLPFQLTST